MPRAKTVIRTLRPGDAIPDGTPKRRICKTSGNGEPRVQMVVSRLRAHGEGSRCRTDAGASGGETTAIWRGGGPCAPAR